MSEADKVFADSIAENYDRYMVPLIFEPYAVDRDAQSRCRRCRFEIRRGQRKTARVQAMS
jgi:hypothetical protein